MSVFLPVPTNPGDLEALSKPVVKLIDVVSKGIGAAANPLLTKANARANAEAKRLTNEADCEIITKKVRVPEKTNPD